MRLALNMGKMATWGFSSTAIEETQQLIQNHCAEVREEKNREVEFPVYSTVMAAVERHTAMGYNNHTAGCLQYQNGTTKNLQTCWRRKRTGANSTLKTFFTRKPPLPPGDTDGKESYEMERMTSGCVYTHSLLPKTQFLNPNAYAKDSKRDKDFIPDLLSTLSAVWKYH
jgi:hypothetical protein